MSCLVLCVEFHLDKSIWGVNEAGLGMTSGWFCSFPDLRWWWRSSAKIRFSIVGNAREQFVELVVSCELLALKSKLPRVSHFEHFRENVSQRILDAMSVFRTSFGRLSSRLQQAGFDNWIYLENNPFLVLCVSRAVFTRGGVILQNPEQTVQPDRQ